jgi:hypothetical protein
MKFEPLTGQRRRAASSINSVSLLAICINVIYHYSKEIRKMLAKKTSKNQLTLPKGIADRFPGVDLFDATVEENRIVLVPVKLTPITASLDSIREKMEKLGITEGDVADAVKWARKNMP